MQINHEALFRHLLLQLGGVIASDCSEKMTKLIFNKAYNSLLCGTVVSVIDKESHSEITLAAEIGSDALC